MVEKDEKKWAYRFDATSGQLFFDAAGKTMVIGDKDLALAYTVWDGDACLHKHGAVDLVTKAADKIRQIDDTVEVITVPWEAIKDPDIGPAVLEEINLCLEISGRVGKLPQRLAELSAQKDVEACPVLD